MALSIREAAKEFVVLVHGVPVRCFRQGVGAPLLLLHGLIGSVENWRRNMDRFSENATVYAIDLPNMGRSGRVLGLNASLTATAEFLAELMRVLGIERADIAAHSRGGAVAMTLATLFRERVRSLILFAPANPFCDRSIGIRRFYGSWLGSGFARLVPHLPRKLKAMALGRMYGDPSRVPADALHGYTNGLELPGTIDHVLRILQTWTVDMSLLERSLAALSSLPVLLIWGDRDRAVGLDSGYELQRRLGNADLRMLPGVGHIPFEEAPEAVNPIVAEWLRRMGLRGGSPGMATV